jgi:hypothetical protein
VPRQRSLCKAGGRRVNRPGGAVESVRERLIVTRVHEFQPKASSTWQASSSWPTPTPRTASPFGTTDVPFQLKERVSAADVDNPHFSSLLIERIGWALADAEDAERAGEGSRR